MEPLRGAFRQDLARLLRQILAWLAKMLTFGRRRRRSLEEPSRLTIVRRLYGGVLRWGAASGHPREPSQTPFEYQQTLCAAIPAHGTDVVFLTEAYARARYGGQAPTEAELHRLRESRRRLKRQATRKVDNRTTVRVAEKAEDDDDTHR